VVLDLGVRTATTGDVITFFGCIPPVPPTNPVDIYLLGLTPSGQIYSVLSNGAMIKGIHPYLRNVSDLPNGLCGVTNTHTVCKEAQAGTYYIGLFVLPSGVPFNIHKAIGSDIIPLTIVK